MSEFGDDFGELDEDTEMQNLPLYTERKADGIYRYRRRVPKELVDRLGKGYLYRNLGRTKKDIVGKWSAAHAEISENNLVFGSKTIKLRDLNRETLNLNSTDQSMLNGDQGTANKIAMETVALVGQERWASMENRNGCNSYEIKNCRLKSISDSFYWDQN
jgi:hypothetical protein